MGCIDCAGTADDSDRTITSISRSVFRSGRIRAITLTLIVHKFLVVLLLLYLARKSMSNPFRCQSLPLQRAIATIRMFDEYQRFPSLHPALVSKFQVCYLDKPGGN